MIMIISLVIIIVIILVIIIVIIMIITDLQCPYLGLRSRQSRSRLSALPTLFYHPCQPPDDHDHYHDDGDDDDDDEDDDDDDWTWSLPLVQMYISFPTSPGKANH